MAAVTIYKGDGNVPGSDFGEPAYQLVNIDHRGLLGDVLDNQRFRDPKLSQLIHDLAPISKTDLKTVVNAGDECMYICLPHLEPKVIWFLWHGDIPYETTRVCSKYMREAQAVTNEENLRVRYRREKPAIARGLLTDYY